MSDVVPENTPVIEKTKVEIRPETPKPPLIPKPEDDNAVSKLAENLGAQEKADEVREALEEEKEPYKDSTVLEKLRRRKEQDLPLKIAFLDIDSTLSGNPKEAVKIRELLDEKGYVVFFVSSRTEEMTMSKAEYKKSVELGLERPAPKLAVGEDGKKIEAFPDEVEDFAGLYDADGVAAATGSRIFLRQQSGGYEEDKGFTQKMKQDSTEFRQRTMDILNRIDPKHSLFVLSPVDNSQNFEQNITDVESPDFRVQLNFQPSTAEQVVETTGATDAKVSATEGQKQTELQKKQETERRIRALLEDPGIDAETKNYVRNLKITDDSNPDKGKYSLYLTPLHGSKERAVDSTLEQLSQRLNADFRDFELFMAGDSWPDVAMGLYAGRSAKVDFFVALNSRLTTPLTETEIRSFAGQKLPLLSRFFPREEGVIDFKRPSPLDSGGQRINRERTVYIGDKLFPQASTAPQSVRQFIETKL